MNDEIERLEREVAEAKAIRARIDEGTATDADLERLSQLNKGASSSIAGAALFGVLMISLAVGAVFWTFSGSVDRADSMNTGVTTPIDRQAGYVCEQAMRRQLLDPESARFEGFVTDIVAESSVVSIVQVSGIVIARNPLGGMTSRQYECTANLSDGRWSTHSVKILD